MIAAPPLEAGGLQDKVTRPLPAVAVSPVGGPGFRIWACGSRTAVRTADAAGPPLPAAVPGGGPCPASMAGQPASTAARHVPATVVAPAGGGRPGATRRRLSGDGSRMAPPGEADGHHEVSRRRGNLLPRRLRAKPLPR